MRWMGIGYNLKGGSGGGKGSIDRRGRDLSK